MIGAVATMVRPPPGPELRVLHNVTADELIARGHAVLERAAGDGLDWAAVDIAGLQHLLDAPDRMAIWRHAHDLRGNAGTFGWMLATEVATLLCRYIDRQGDGSDMRTLRALTGALLVVFTERLKGDGGAAGAGLVKELCRLPGVPTSGSNWAGPV